MTGPARRIATYDDVLAAPEGMTAEILNGELHLSPRPGVPHQLTASSMGADVLVRFARERGGPGGWSVLRRVELHLGEHDPRSVVAVPDLSGWRKERMPQPPLTAAVQLSPDWVCEILSPGAANARRDRVLKADAYHRAGVQWMWIVDPVVRTIEVMERTDAGWLRVHTHDGDGEARLPPFEAVAFDTAPWWPPPAPDADADPAG
jgi:Uma2 family endonuclease